MQKNILITGATDGIGLEAARMLAVQGHNLIIHGRNPVKLADVEKTLSALSTGGKLTSYLCDLSELKDKEGFHLLTLMHSMTGNVMRSSELLRWCWANHNRL